MCEDDKSLTLGGCLAVGAGQGNHTLVDLDSDHCAIVLHHLGEELATVGLLVQGLVEEDDAADAGLDAVVGGEQKLPVQPPVLLGVLRIDALEALSNAACVGERGRGQTRFKPVRRTDVLSSFISVYLFGIPSKTAYRSNSPLNALIII